MQIAASLQTLPGQTPDRRDKDGRLRESHSATQRVAPAQRALLALHSIRGASTREGRTTQSTVTVLHEAPDATEGRGAQMGTAASPLHEGAQEGPPRAPARMFRGDHLHPPRPPVHWLEPRSPDHFNTFTPAVGILGLEECQSLGFSRGDPACPWLQAPLLKALRRAHPGPTRLAPQVLALRQHRAPCSAPTTRSPLPTVATCAPLKCPI